MANESIPPSVPDKCNVIDYDQKQQLQVMPSLLSVLYAAALSVNTDNSTEIYVNQSGAITHL